MGRSSEERDSTAEERAKLFEKYVEPNLGLVYDTVSSYTANSSNIDDNSQEVLIWILRYIDTYDPSKNIQTWLITITIRYVGKLEAKRAPMHDSDQVDEHEEDSRKSYINKYAPKSRIEYRHLDDHSVFVDETAHFEDLGASDELEVAIPKVNPKYARAFLLRHGMGWSLKEIAQCEKITENTAKMRIHMGKKALQKELGNE